MSSVKFLSRAQRACAGFFARIVGLEITYVLRELFQIPGGNGRIFNIDESMTYRYDQEQKSGLTKVYLLILFQES